MRILLVQPDLVGTAGFTAEFPHAQDVCAAARRFAPGAKVVVVGTMPS